MISTMVMHSLLKINIQHYYSRNYKTRIGAYTILSQLKVTKYLLKWIFRLCHMQCIFLVIRSKINQVPYQVIEYDDEDMFQAQLMDNTQVEIFIDNGATPSILQLSIYNRHPILQKYPRMESHTPIHTGGSTI